MNCFNEFKKEIDLIKSQPCKKAYPLKGYDKKVQNVLRDIDENHNYSWIKEMWERQKDNLDAPAIKYRGKIFTYKDFFTMSYKYAKALKANGIKKGQEFVCAIENTPEFPFIMGAASMVGAVTNLVSAEFNDDYLREILERADSQFVFVSDMSFSKLAPTLLKLNKEKIIIPISIDYSLNNENPYKKITEEYYKLDEEAYQNNLAKFDNILNIDSFLASGENYKGKVIEDMDLNDPFTKTYTSGSTNWDRPKGLSHKIRTYTTSARFQDSDISSQRSMNGHTSLVFIKTMSDTDFLSGVSDKMMHGATVALEPINIKEFFLSSIVINKPSIAVTATSAWIYAMKQHETDERYKNVNFRYLLAATAAGEPLSAGEEKALNRWLKKNGIGLDHIKIPVSCMSVGGGTSEQGGVFFRMFRSISNKLPSHIGIKEPIGMKPHKSVRIAVLRKDGTHCKPMEKGHLVANSPCQMEGYVNSPEAEKEFYITDVHGETWGTMGTMGYYDKKGNVYMKGRVSDNLIEPYDYEIADVILRDTKKIRSCSVISLDDNNDTRIAHIMPQEGVSFDKSKVLKGATQRLVNEFGEEILDKLYFRTRTTEEEFKLLHTLKRSQFALLAEGLSEKCILAKDYHENRKEKAKVKTLVKK